MTKKIKYKINYIVIVFLLAIAATQPIKADTANISLLTCSPGEEIYSLFGHSALRYCDPTKNIDIVFSYGYFSFEKPNFVWLFVKGETDYMVGAVDYKTFIKEYQYRGSGVTEQILALDSLQKSNLLNNLIEDCKLQNRIYRYNYLYNNCTTKLRDKIFEQINSDEINYTDSFRRTSIREEITKYALPQTWSSFGMNLLLGADIDTPASRETLQFLPINLLNDLANTNINTLPIVAEQNELLHHIEKKKAPNHFTPFNSALLLLLFTLIIMLCEIRSHKLFWWYDTLLMFVQGTSGILQLFMALFSEHPAVDNNYLVIWINPVPLLLLPFVVYYGIKSKTMKFMWIQITMISIFFLTAPFVPQTYPAPIFIFATAYLVRSLFHIYRLKICELSLY